MDDANEFARLQFDEETESLEILLLTCRVDDRFYPGNDPLHLAIRGQTEVWDLVRPLFDLITRNHEGTAIVVHRGARYPLTHALWRALLDRLQDYLESVHLGLPTQVAFIAKTVD